MQMTMIEALNQELALELERLLAGGTRLVVRQHPLPGVHGALDLRVGPGRLVAHRSMWNW